MANKLNDILSVITSPIQAAESMRFKRDLRNVLKNGSIKKSKKIVAEINSQFQGQKTADIKKWRDAHAIALSTDNPVRSELYEIYKDTMLNDHLKSVVKVRLEKILKSKFMFVEKDSGELVPELQELFNKSWFWEFLTIAWESKLWGHSLIQFGNLYPSESGVTDFEFCDVEVVNRNHVKPEWGIIVTEPTDDTGFDYRKAPWNIWTLEVGTKHDLGLLLEATPLAISNKYMGIFWDEFAEMFASPIRIGKTDTENETQRNQMTDMLEEMGRNAWGVFDRDTDIEIVETQKKDAYLVYDKRMDRNNKGMSKLILGTTMTTEDGSSHSQSEVHLEITDSIIESDKRFLFFLINEKLIPFLKVHGYPLENIRFNWDDSEEVPLKTQFEIDKWLYDHFEIDEDYFRKKYNSSITGAKTVAAEGGAAAGK